MKHIYIYYIYISMHTYGRLIPDPQLRSLHACQVDLDGTSGRLNISKTLPGHREEVVWATVDWGDYTRPYFKAATISMQQDVLFWDVPWYKLLKDGQSLKKTQALEDVQEAFWEPKCLPKGFAYRTRIAAYRSDAPYREVCALTGSLHGMIHSWEMHENNKETLVESKWKLEGHTDQISTLAVDWQNGYALSGSCDGTLRLWNLNCQLCERVLRYTDSKKIFSGFVKTMVVDWVSQRAISTAGDVRVWDLRLDNPIALLKSVPGGHSITETLVSFSTESAAFIGSGTAEFWDLRSEVCVAKFHGQPGTVYHLHFGVPEAPEEAAQVPGPHEVSSIHRREDTFEVGFKWPISLANCGIPIASSCGDGWFRSTF